MSTSATFDAVVIGGGPAGSAAAILLAEAGLSVAVIEQKAFPRRKVCGEFLSATNWPLLSRLGIVDAFAESAGPPVLRTAIFAGHEQFSAPLPRANTGEPWGRALSRERLDLLLLTQAAARGTAIFQPARCVALQARGESRILTIEVGPNKQVQELSTSVVIAAHGSWELGDLPTQRQPAPPRPTDWLAFKAHFLNGSLPPGLMPLLAFADGYGGMVHADGGRTSLSCCLRRSRLEQLPRAGGTAGDAVLAHILDSCPILRPVLEGATLDGHWLAAGAIQPGIRPRYRDDIFVIGNAAGEAHPAVAEGISMAMQSAWLLTERLIAQRDDLHNIAARQQIGRSYAAAWRAAFAPRIYAAAAIAQWTSRPKLVAATGLLLRRLPACITLAARLSGKSRIVVPANSYSRTKEWRLT